MPIITSQLVMYHTKDSKKEKQLTELCKQLGFHTRKIKVSDANVRLSTLAGLLGTLVSPQDEKAPKDYQMPELLIFSGLAEEKLDKFLAEYKKSGLPPISLKAVITPYNIGWTVYQLTTELVREQTAIMLERNK